MKMKELMDEFVKEEKRDNRFKSLTQEDYDKFDFTDNDDALKFLLYVSEKNKNNNVKYFIQSIYQLDDFFRWCKIKNIDCVSPMDFNAINFDKLLMSFVSQSNLMFIYKEMIYGLLNYINKKDQPRKNFISKEYVKFIIATSYNGISFSELVKLKKDKFDDLVCWQQKFLINSYEKYVNSEKNIGNVRCEDYLLYYSPKKYDYKKYHDRAKVSMQRQYLQNINNSGINITLNMILYSGFITYVRTQCKSNKEFVNLFTLILRDKKKSENIDNMRLLKYANKFFVLREFKYEWQAVDLKYTCFVLVRKTKWYNDYITSNNC